MTIASKDLTTLLRNLTTLIENGVSLPKALATLAQEKALARYKPVLNTLRLKIETGEAFSAALARYPESFDPILVSQVRVGERAGTLPETLARVCTQRHASGKMKADVKRKLAYPIVVALLGTAVITFMLTFVVPTFEETYRHAGITLPAVTQSLIAISTVGKRYGWMIAIAVLTIAIMIKQLRKHPELALRMDAQLIHLPLIGTWIRDIAVLQLMDVLGNLMEAGFTLAEALRECSDAVGNRAVQRAVLALESAVQRGERFSREMERHAAMFPPVVSQLVIVGEKTGKMPQSTARIREYLREEIERRTTAMVGTIEPILTISLASAIAFVLLAIYLPMFDMVQTVH